MLHNKGAQCRSHPFVLRVVIIEPVAITESDTISSNMDITALSATRAIFPLH